VVMFDGATLLPISGDVANYFDKSKAECINSAMVHKSSAFYDERDREYHWLFANGSNTTLNMELVFDLLTKKWYRIDRGTGKYLQCGMSVRDTNGDKYNYGFIDTGYMERLENGTNFDETSITSTLKTGDLPLAGWMQETEIRHVKNIVKAKASTGTTTLSITHYGDTNTIGDTAEAFYLRSTTSRVVQQSKSVKWGPATFHGFQLSITMTGQATTLEPIGLGVLYKTVRISTLINNGY